MPNAFNLTMFNRPFTTAKYASASLHARAGFFASALVNVGGQTAVIARRMLDYLPFYYRDMPVAVNLIEREAEEMARLSASIDDVSAQFFIETATWGLTRWERIFGVTTDASKTYAQRREVLLGKMRGIGAVSAELIASSYANGEVSVSFRPADYTVVITFTSERGIPDQIDELKAAIRDITPAHLAIEYVFQFYSYGEIADNGRTYGAVTAAGRTYGEILNEGVAQEWRKQRI